MLLVSFSCIDPDIEIENKQEYVKKIYSHLFSEGFVDFFVVDDPNDEKGRSSIQSIGEDSYESRYVYKDNLPFLGLNNESPSYVFKIQYIFGTYKSGLQFTINILSDSYNPSPLNDYVEKLKFSIKTFIKNDWRKIEWLVDKDSECLSVELYPNIFRTENLIRRMISELLTKYYGTSWWDIFIPIKIKNKYHSRMLGYRSVAPGFANIDDHLLSIDVGDLIEILTLKLLKWNPTYDDTINSMISCMTEWNDNKVKDILKNQFLVEIDFWDKYFNKYLPDSFIDKIKDFEKNRNHVAHNKMLDRQAYQVIKNNVTSVYQDVSDALDKISITILSEEEKLMFETTPYPTPVSYEEVVEMDAHVKIRNNSSICYVLDEALEELFMKLEESLRFRSDLELSLSKEKISIEYKITNVTCSFDVSMEIDETPGAKSKYIIEGDDFYDELIYINGEAFYDEEQSIYSPVTQEEYPYTDVVVNNILKYIDAVFPNLRMEADESMYRIVKEGGISPVISDFPCDECGEFYIASDDTFAEKGVCLNCGAKHEIHECCRCGNVYEGELDDEIPMCDNCKDALERQ